MKAKVFKDEAASPAKEGVPMVGDLRGILKEAIAGGIAARKARILELMEEPRQEGRVQVHSPGWCWIKISPQTAAKAILPCVPGVRIIKPCQEQKLDFEPKMFIILNWVYLIS